MMARYLLAAEADKIQDFIFRSSRLREVVGASQLLSRFCKGGIEPLLEKYGGDPIVKDGGGFRIAFEGEDDAEVQTRASQFGADLAELYRLALGGNLSVAVPEPMNSNFPDVNKGAGKKLRRAKEHRLHAVVDPHMPYVAYCASCGVGLGAEHGLRFKEIEDGTENEDKKHYLCRVCRTKAQERWLYRQSMLGEFLLAVVGDDKDIEGFTPLKTPEMTAVYDPRGRNYVAYLVADGNGMGKIFGECNKAQLKQLSEELPQIVRKSLAEATGQLMARLERRYDKKEDKDRRKEIIPALPLILGGDDVFVLIPAPYALDFAQRFCVAFEAGMKQLLKESEFRELHVPSPTMAAAVVICKSKYPYALAHRRGEELLAEAKRMCKQLAAEKNEFRSAVNFEVILGNRLTGQDEDEDREQGVRPSLKPYWATPEKTTLSNGAQRYGVSLDNLLAQRLALRNVPSKRMHELRTAFADIPNNIKNNERDERLADWEKGLKRPFQRSGHAMKLWAAMAEMGQTPNPDGLAHHWREVKWKDAEALANGLPDLLEVWDFAQNLEKDLSAYDPQEVEEGEE